MSKTTLRIMRSIEKRMESYVYLEATHCGHEVEEAKANASRNKLMDYIARRVEQLVQKAGLP